MKCIENEILHEIFCEVSRLPRYISCYIAENRFPLGQCSRLLLIFSSHILFTFYCSREKKSCFLTEVANLEVTPFAPLGGLRTESISGARTLLEKFWQISLYLTDDAIAELYVT